MINTYLPDACIGKPVEEMNFDEFFTSYAMAEYARKIRVQDIEAGVSNGISMAFGDE